MNNWLNTFINSRTWRQYFSIQSVKSNAVRHISRRSLSRFCTLILNTESSGGFLAHGQYVMLTPSRNPFLPLLYSVIRVCNALTFVIYFQIIKVRYVCLFIWHYNKKVIKLIIIIDSKYYIIALVTHQST